MTGPLGGLRVIEVGGIGPGPFAAMVLADQGADVVRVDRLHGGGLVSPNDDPALELLHRGRRSLALDLRHPDGVATLLRMVERADVLLEGQRPGVMERLGIGPEACRARNPALVYGRMTGWGQDGPYAAQVGHDLDYIAVAGTLGLLGRQGQPPTVPPAVVGDFGAGGLLLAFGVLAALYERSGSGQGQVVDAAIVDGAALLATAFHGYDHTGVWAPERGTNLVDSGAPNYEVYETADHRWLAVAPLEPAFYADALRVLELDPDALPDVADRANWPELKAIFARVIATRSCAEWLARAEGTNACMSPVLSIQEARSDPHIAARSTIVEHHGVPQPAPAPRFSRTPPALGTPPATAGQHTAEVLAEWGFSPEETHALGEAGAIGPIR